MISHTLTTDENDKYTCVRFLKRARLFRDAIDLREVPRLLSLVIRLAAFKVSSRPLTSESCF